MKIEVRYFSRRGNTKKLAEAIARAVGVEAKTTDALLMEDVDILFLGSSDYCGRIDENVKNFIEDIRIKVGKVINFSTAKISKKVKKLLNEKDIPIGDEEFHCKGALGILYRKRPNENDLKDVAEFAQKIVKTNNKIY